MSSQTGLAKARARRQRRARIIITVVLLAVVAGFALAVKNSASWFSADANAPTCRASTPPPDPRSTFRLNVYNAGTESGAAGEVAKALKTRNFAIGAIGNDPYEKKLSGEGEIRFGPTGAEFAREYVQVLAPQAKLVQDGRADSSVDIALGSEFPDVPSASPTPTPTPTATPSGSASC